MKPEVEAAKRAELKKYKFRMTSLLVLMAVIYLACRWYGAHLGHIPMWLGIIQAGSEAGMVGGLADWFAVTALFRHPMGVPIPHTALVPNNQQKIGDSLANFVGDEFLKKDLIKDKLTEDSLPLKLGQWLLEEDNAALVASRAGEFVSISIKQVDPADAQAAIDALVIDKFTAPQWGPPAGRVLEQLIADGKTEPVIEEVCEFLHRKAVGSELLISRLVEERAPSWAPQFINDIAADKAYRELVAWTSAVASQPQHDFRQVLRRTLDRFAADLQQDPEMIERVEGLKRDALASPKLQNLSAVMWNSVSSTVLGAVEDEHSPLYAHLVGLLQKLGQRLTEDEQLRDKAEGYMLRTVFATIEKYGDRIVDYISETINSWDPAETSEKIELLVGRDLQFIRLNGTVVGALAGIAIYLVSHLLFFLV